MTRMELAGEQMDLLPERAVWWGARGALLVADVHLGKASTFRARGLPVPEGLCASIARRDLDRLGAVIERLGARELVILGDLLHAREGRDASVLEVFAQWRARFTPERLAITLVRGNHDVKSGDPPECWSMRCVNEAERLGPLVLLHDPAFAARAEMHAREYALAGHIHPAVVLEGPGVSERAPCFWFTSRVGVLPAFGTFTGGARVTPRVGDRVFVVGPGRVVEVGGRVAARAG